MCYEGHYDRAHSASEKSTRTDPICTYTNREQEAFVGTTNHALTLMHPIAAALTESDHVY